MTQPPLYVHQGKAMGRQGGQAKPAVAGGSLSTFITRKTLIRPSYGEEDVSWICTREGTKILTSRTSSFNNRIQLRLHRVSVRQERGGGGEKGEKLASIRLSVRARTERDLRKAMDGERKKGALLGTYRRKLKVYIS